MSLITCVLCQIADFGLARSQQYLTSGTATVGVGTPAWSSPEYLNKEKLADSSDVYSLGVVSLQ